MIAVFWSWMSAGRKEILQKREMQQYENLLHETKSELTEQMYLWEKTKSGASPSSGDHAGNLKENRKL